MRSKLQDSRNEWDKVTSTEQLSAEFHSLSRFGADLRDIKAQLTLLAKQPAGLERTKEALKLRQKAEALRIRATVSATKLTFKESPLFTAARKELISAQISDFRRYLTEIGFEIQPECPPIGVTKGAAKAVYSEPGPVYESSVFIPEDRLDDRETITRVYGQYVFHKLFPHRPIPEDRFNMQLTWIYNDYYVSSFFDRYRLDRTSSFAYWTNGAWDIRSKYGKSFADRLLFYAFATWYSPQPKDTFDEFFWGRISAGLNVLSNSNGEYDEPVWAIFKARGLRAEAISR